MTQTKEPKLLTDEAMMEIAWMTKSELRREGVSSFETHIRGAIVREQVRQIVALFDEANSAPCSDDPHEGLREYLHAHRLIIEELRAACETGGEKP
jgi:hypothetical protein